MNKIASIGECMLELSAAQAQPDLRRLGFGGDTLNTAVYLARLEVPVDYVTALGDDPYSERMIEAWRGEQVGTDLVQRIAGRLPGLYMIEVDERGERRFFYWRQQAPAREIFSNERTADLCQALLRYEWLYLSGISLSLYGEAGRERLFDLLRQFRAQGGKVAFDSNYRPRAWSSVEVARREIRDQLALTDIVLSSLEDETGLNGVGSAEEACDLIHGFGPRTVVIKQGGAGLRGFHQWTENHRSRHQGRQDRRCHRRRRFLQCRVPRGHPARRGSAEGRQARPSLRRHRDRPSWRNRSASGLPRCAKGLDSARFIDIARHSHFR